MFKKLLFLVIFIAVTNVYSQSFSGKGDQKLQIGLNFYGHGSGIKATYDYGLGENISIGGGTVFYNTGSYESDFFIFGRGDFHFAEPINAPDAMDLYLGVELGLIGNSYFGLGGHVGIRYALKNNVAVFAEIGNNGALGLAIRL